MEEMGSKLKIELERLIGENPIVASEHGRAEESVQKRTSSMVANSCSGTSLETLHSNGNLEDGKVCMNKLQQPSTGQIRTGESNGAGDGSLTSTLEKLSLGAEGTGQTWLKNQPNLIDDQLQSYLNEESMVAVSSLRSSNHLTNGYSDIHATGHGPQNCRSVCDGFKKWQVGHSQVFETPSPARPFTHEVRATNLTNLQCALPSHHEQMLLSGRSPVHYAFPHQLNQAQICSNCSQEDQFHGYRMQGQYPYGMHHFHNQPFEYSNLVHSCDTNIGRIRFQNPGQQCFEVPVSHSREQSKHEGFWHGSARCTGSGISNPEFSTHVDTVQGLEKSSRQSSPRKILTRSPNGVDYMKVAPADPEKLKYFVKQNGFLCPRCYSKLNGLSPTTDCPCHENLRVASLLSRYVECTVLPPPCETLDEATGKMYVMAKDQYGCRFLQRMFCEGTREDVEKIFNEIIDHVTELMTDPFGNYLIQKLLGVCDEKQRMQILHKVTNRHGELIRISCNMHGTRVVQRLIETLRTPEQFSMVVSSLKSGIVILMKNLNGNHVAQHCLQFMVPNYIEFLFDAATKSCVEVATDRHGCCVLQKCLGCSNVGHRDRLISEIARNALVLSQDQYGNYVVQYTLELARNSMLPWVTAAIFRRLEGHFVDLSIQKYSSNVVEKCVCSGEEYLTKIVYELMNDARLSEIMQDPYGNYAIQTVLSRSELCNSSLHAKLVDEIRPHVPALRTNMYGKKVLAMLVKTN